MGLGLGYGCTCTEDRAITGQGHFNATTMLHRSVCEQSGRVGSLHSIIPGQHVLVGMWLTTEQCCYAEEQAQPCCSSNRPQGWPVAHLKFSYVVWLVATSQVWKPLRPHTNQKKMKVKIIRARAAPLWPADTSGVAKNDIRLAPRHATGIIWASDTAASPHLLPLQFHNGHTPLACTWHKVVQVPCT